VYRSTTGGQQHPANVRRYIIAEPGALIGILQDRVVRDTTGKDTRRISNIWSFFVGTWFLDYQIPRKELKGHH
jgi:acetyl-CoA carboxylase beta subunit